MAHLGEPGGFEDASGADVDLAPGDVLPGRREDRIALERTGAAVPREIDGRPRERVADPASPEAGTGDEARDRPDAVVELVLGAPLPGDAVVAQQARVGAAGR